MDNKYSEIEIYDALKEKYGEYLKDEIEYVSIVQMEDAVFLNVREIHRLENGLIKKTVYDVDLNFYGDDDENKLMFTNENSIEVNVDKFLNGLDAVDISFNLDLFKEEHAEKICNEYRKNEEVEEK